MSITRSIKRLIFKLLRDQPSHSICVRPKKIQIKITRQDGATELLDGKNAEFKMDWMIVLPNDEGDRMWCFPTKTESELTVSIDLWERVEESA